jgi:hypothetical protein
VIKRRGDFDKCSASQLAAMVPVVRAMTVSANELLFCLRRHRLNLTPAGRRVMIRGLVISLEISKKALYCGKYFLG